MSRRRVRVIASLLTALAGGGASLGVAGPAVAYSEPALFPADAVTYGGGGGRWFTGSPRDGFTCEVCHVDATPLELELTGLPSEPYAPGAFYVFELRWPTSERVTVVGELVDAAGEAVGELTVPPPESQLPADLCEGGGFAPAVETTPDGRVVASTPACGAARLRLGWRAPADAVDVWLHVAAVAGDGSEDPRGDQLRVLARPLVAPAGEPAGCRVADGPARAPATALLVLLALAARRRRS